MTTQKTTWYIEPKDSHTNKVLYNELGGPEMVYLENNFGKSLKAFQVEYTFITDIKKSKNDIHLKFKVYKKQGKNSPAREFDFDNLKKQKKSKTPKN